MRFTLGKEIIPIFAVASPMWEILLDGKRLCIVHANEGEARQICGRLNKEMREAGEIK